MNDLFVVLQGIGQYRIPFKAQKAQASEPAPQRVPAGPLFEALLVFWRKKKGEGEKKKGEK